MNNGLFRGAGGNSYWDQPEAQKNKEFADSFGNLRVGTGDTLFWNRAIQNVFSFAPPGPPAMQPWVHVSRPIISESQDVALSSIVQFSSTFTLARAGFGFGMASLFNNASTVQNQPGAGTGNFFGPVFGFVSQPTLQCNDATFNMTRGIDFYAFPKTTRPGTGGVTVATYDQFQADINHATGNTITVRRGFWANDNAGAGTITTQVGVEIGKAQGDLALAPTTYTGATNNIGLRNASTTGFTPSASQTISAAGDTVTTGGATFKYIAGASPITLTSTPTIPDGVTDGQLLVITNVFGATITFQSGATFNLRLGGGTRAVAVRSTLTLIWSAVLSDWLEVSFVA